MFSSFVQVLENSGAVCDSENKRNYISEVLFEDKRHYYQNPNSSSLTTMNWQMPSRNQISARFLCHTVSATGVSANCNLVHTTSKTLLNKFSSYYSQVQRKHRWKSMKILQSLFSFFFPGKATHLPVHKGNSFISSSFNT